MAARPGFEPGPPASGAVVVPVPPSRTVLDLVWTERIELPSPVSDAGALAVAPRPGVVMRTDGGTRTPTDGVLSAVPLPLGYAGRLSIAVDRAGFEPAPSSLQGRRAASYASGPGGVALVARAGIEPAGKEYETSLI